MTEQEIKESSKSAQVLYSALKEYNITGLYDKIILGKTNPFIVVVSEIAKGDIESPYNIYIDVEEYGVDEEGGLLSGEFTLNFGMSHSHFTYGYDGGTVEIISDDLAYAVHCIQNGELFSYQYATGLKQGGFREMLPGAENPKISFEAEEIIRYYMRNYKPEDPVAILDEENAELFNEIEAILGKSKPKILYYRYNDEKVTEVELYQDEE
ncbi:MAG: hypothetical protein IKB42_01595 [Clostridia bacterium]|nr:hypothetical protein [Clostridia bacterium]